jgi:hypothetical protein
VGSVRVHDELRSMPAFVVPRLQAVHLLEFDVAGRTALERLDDEGTRRFEDTPGAARIRLAGGRGSLYHFVRAGGSADTAFGWFLVGADGIARVLHEIRANAGGTTRSSIA